MQFNVYDIAYGFGLALSAPYWFLKPTARRKVLLAVSRRMGHVERRAPGTGILLHAVSVGEVNATSALVRWLLQERPELQITVSTTTDTGHDRALALYQNSPGVTVVRFPLDFSSAIDRLLDTLQPALVALMELELWPNFLLQCQKRHVPVVLLNGRITAPSFRRYRMAKWIARRMLDRLTAICVQDESNANMFRALGAPASRVQITGTMKFDSATVGQSVPGDIELAGDVGLEIGQPCWVCGSTGPGEEEIILRQHARLRERHPELRLVIVPRKPERFDEVARLIIGAGFSLLRRSQPMQANEAGSTSVLPVILGDTMGELRKFYSLASLVFVGRTLVDLGPKLHGSDMIEPAALAKPIVVGPFTGNFADAMMHLRTAGAIVEVADGDGLGQAIETLLLDRETAVAMGQKAQAVVRSQQGATERNGRVILQQLPE